METKMNAAQAARIAELSIDPGHDICILDVAGVFSEGRAGRPEIRHRKRYAGTVARHLLGLEVGDPIHAGHLCGNPRCLNVAHLYRTRPGRVPGAGRRRDA